MTTKSILRKGGTKKEDYVFDRSKREKKKKKPNAVQFNVGELTSSTENPKLNKKPSKKAKEKQAKKEAFRKYLESSGVLDALTKVLVALYEQNDKPTSAVEFVQQKLGGPSLSEYEKLQAEMSDLQIRYNELLTVHQETCSQLEELKNTHTVASSKDNVEVDLPKP
ncbi:uncharacterized protein LOC143623683 [Bidens hawaiensis]|uniref:uncharacterized protein LOC143623683 n=1 Tax=Bidens hawaiensis TaxID=980011 RepID=UPI004049B206